jgi:hypothetical protein
MNLSSTQHVGLSLRLLTAQIRRPASDTSWDSRALWYSLPAEQT